MSTPPKKPTTPASSETPGSEESTSPKEFRDTSPEAELRRLKHTVKRAVERADNLAAQVERKYLMEEGTESTFINPKGKGENRIRVKRRWRKKKAEDISHEDLRAAVLDLKDIMAPQIRACELLHSILRKDTAAAQADDVPVDLQAYLKGGSLKPEESTHAHYRKKTENELIEKYLKLDSDGNPEGSKH